MNTFFSLSDLSQRWGIDRDLVYQSVRAGQIRVMRLTKNGKYWVPRAEVERLERGDFLPHPTWG